MSSPMTPRRRASRNVRSLVVLIRPDHCFARRAPRRTALVGVVVVFLLCWIDGLLLRLRHDIPSGSASPASRIPAGMTVTSERFSRAILGLGHGFGQHLTHLQIWGNNTRANSAGKIDERKNIRFLVPSLDAATAPHLYPKLAFPRRQSRSRRRSHHYCPLTHFGQTWHNGGMAAPTDHQVCLILFAKNTGLGTSAGYHRCDAATAVRTSSRSAR